MGWLSGWGYRKTVSITGQSGAGTDYQVDFSIGDASGGDFHLENHCTSFPNDIQVTDNDQTTPLDYWVEDLTVDPITMWVEVADDLGGNVDIYVYYGKSGATSDSNGANTFISYQDFDEQSDGDAPTGWTKIGANIFEVDNVQSHTLSNSLLSAGASTGGYKSLSVDAGKAVEFWARRLENDRTTDFRFLQTSWTNENIGPYIMFRSNGQIEYYDTASHNLMAYSAGIWYRFTIKGIDLTNDQFDLDINGVNKVTNANFFLNHDLSSLDLFGTFMASTSPSQWLDSICIRKYVSPEPAFSSAGSEESAPVGHPIMARWHGIPGMNYTGRIGGW